MKAPVKSANFEPVPAGNHIARLYQIIHIGTVDDTYMGEPRQVDKIRLVWELSNEKKVFREGEEPKPYSVSREVTFSMNEKATLRALVEGMIGTSLLDHEAEAFDLDDLLGKPCLLNVVHEEGKDRVYAKVKSVSPLVKGMEAPAIINTARAIDVKTITNDEYDQLPQWLQEKMAGSQEWRHRTKGIAPDDPKAELSPDDIPF